MPVTVVLAEDNLIVREGIATLLSTRGSELELVAQVASVDPLLEAVEVHRPDVVVTDIRMPPTFTDEGIRVATMLRERHPGVGVVVLSGYADPEYALALLADGAERRAYLLKERVRDRAQLVAAIHAVATGGAMIDPKIVAPLVVQQREGAALAELTPRELEVLAQIAEGCSNAAIAASLVLTKRAVEKHINSIFLKLGLSHAHDVSKRVKATLLFLADAERGV